MKISLKTATLAKEKGYTNDSKEWVFYDNQNDCITVTNVEGGISGQEKTVKLCTQAELQKWLREEHSILILPNHYGGTKFPHLTFNCLIKDFSSPDQIIQIYDTYEEALEAGLLEGLKAIKL